MVIMLRIILRIGKYHKVASGRHGSTGALAWGKLGGELSNDVRPDLRVHACRGLRGELGDRAGPAPELVPHAGVLEGCDHLASRKLWESDLGKVACRVGLDGYPAVCIGLCVDLGACGE